MLKRPPCAFVIGHPIRHSRSPMLHGYWLDTLRIAGRYEAVDVAPDALGAFISGFREAGFVGGNVTIPHKQAVFASLDHIGRDAAAIGAVNTIWLDGQAIVGGNTDALGFLTNLDEQAPGWDQAERALVLGAGGAARAVVHGLLERGLDIMVANRTAATAEALAAGFGERVIGGGFSNVPRWLAQAQLVVNASALGMTGAPALEIDLSPLRPDAVVCDLVYVPLVTPLLADATARGHRTADGLGMLLHQAVPGFAHWFGQVPNVTGELRALLAADISKSR